MLTSCTTCPKSEAEKVKYLDPGYFPELIDLSYYPVKEKRELLDFFAEIYTEHLKLLISAKSTGYFINDIDLEIEDNQAVLNWLNDLSLLE